MKMMSGLILAMAASAVSSSAFADGGATSLSASAVAAHEASVAAVSAKLAALRDKRAVAAKAATGADLTTVADLVNPTTSPGLPVASLYRAYPPSCAADPVPDVPSNVIASQRMNLFARDSAGNPAGLEAVTVTLWRIPCSSSHGITPYNDDGGFNSMTYLRIDRDVSGVTTTYPTFPQLLIGTPTSPCTTQDGSGCVAVRAAVEPNTVISEAPYDSPIYFSTTYVLENYPFGAAYLNNYNLAFNLVVNPNDGNNDDIAQLQANNYAPTSSPALPIEGFLNTAWYDTTHGGEGMDVAIFESGNGLVFTAYWYTYDALGLPFWLVAQATVARGATSVVDAPVYYFTDGGFAGNFGATSTSSPWGTMSFTFPDCNHMNFDFSGQTDAATNGPSGSGSRSWTRLANLNGLACE